MLSVSDLQMSRWPNIRCCLGIKLTLQGYCSQIANVNYGRVALVATERSGRTPCAKLLTEKVVNRDGGLYVVCIDVPFQFRRDDQRQMHRLARTGLVLENSAPFLHAG